MQFDFVLTTGVADQLQTNYASDLRNILKTVFIMCASEPYMPIGEENPTATNHSLEDEQSNEASGTSVAASGTDQKPHNHSPKDKSSPTNGRVRFEGNAPTNGSVANDDVVSNENSEIVNSSSASKSSASGESPVFDEGPSTSGDQVAPKDPSGSKSSSDPVGEPSAVSDGSTPEPKERKRHRSGSRNRRTTAYQGWCHVRLCFFLLFVNSPFF